MKKLTILIAMLMAMAVWSEPSDWVRNELIKKEHSYLSIGLLKCDEAFARTQNKDVRCGFNWDESRLEFTQRVYVDLSTPYWNQDDPIDSKIARARCKAELHPALKSFTEGYFRPLYIKYFQGFFPHGHSDGDDRMEKFIEFYEKSEVWVELVPRGREGKEKDALCRWKFEETEPELFFGVRYFRGYRD